MGSKYSKSKENSSTSFKTSNVVITSLDRAQLELKLQRDKLLAAVKKYEGTAKEERDRAAYFLRCGNRRKALYCLKRQKLQEQQVTCVTDMLDNVQRLINTIEFSEIELEVVDALKNGKDELTKLNAMMKVDDIAGLMESTTETVEEARRINDVLAQPLGTWDDDALLEEIHASAVEHVGEVENIVEEVQVPTHTLPEIEVVDTPVDASEGKVSLYT